MQNQIKSSSNIAKRRRLADLYERGRLVVFGPSGPREPTEERQQEDVAVFVRPPSPIQKDAAIREAQAARSRAILSAKDEDTAEAQSTKAFIVQMTDELLLGYVLDAGEQERTSIAQRRILSQKEWEDFDTLRDAARQWEEAGRPDNEEWAAFKKRDEEFGTQYNAVMLDLRDSDRESLESMPRAVLERKALERRMEAVATAEFVKVWEQQMLFYSCRDDEDHNELFFLSPEEVGEYPEFVGKKLLEVMNDFLTEVSEVKA